MPTRCFADLALPPSRRGRDLYDDDTPVEDHLIIGCPRPRWYLAFIPVFREWLRRR